MDGMCRLGHVCLWLALFSGDAYLVEADDHDNNRGWMQPFTIPMGRPHRDHARKLWPVGSDYTRYHCVQDSSVACDRDTATRVGCPQSQVGRFESVTG